MKTARSIGWVLLALALVMVGHEALNALEGEGYRLIATGEFWFMIDRALGSASLAATQGFVERNISPWIWINIVQTVLLAPAWLVFGLPGALLVWLCKGQRRSYGLDR